MKSSKRRTETVRNRSLLIEQRLTQKYRLNQEAAKDSAPTANNEKVSSGNLGGSIVTGQSLSVVRAFACDDGAPIHLQYDFAAFCQPGENPHADQGRSASLNSQSLPYHFEAFGGVANQSAPLESRADRRPPTPNENEAARLQNGGTSPVPTQIPGHDAAPCSPGSTPTAQLDPVPSIPNPSAQRGTPNVPTGNAPHSSAPDWKALDHAVQQSMPPAQEDTFVSDLQALISEARRRADTGQETPALSPAPAAQTGAPAVASPTASPPQPPAPTAVSPAAQAQIAGTDTVNRHALFDQLGRQIQGAVTFDMGTVPVDKTFAAIEASLDAQASQREAGQRAQAKRKATPAKPLSPIEVVEDMSLMAAPRPAPSPAGVAAAQAIPTRASALEAYMLSSEIPLDPGVGGRSIGVSALAIGDLIVSTTREVPSRLIRFGTQAPVSHAILYVGDGLVVEAISEGVVLRPVEQAVAGSYLVVAFRHPGLTPEQALRVRDYAGQQIGKQFNYEGIVRQAGFQLDKKVFCGGKTGEEHDRCVRWVGRVNLGTATNDRFFCSELVLKAYETAGVPLTTTPPNYSSPGDLPELQQNGMLAYVGHLKYES